MAKMDKRSHPIEHLANDAEIASKAHIFPLPGKRKRKYPLRLILIVLLPIVAFAAYTISDLVITYPGQDSLKVYAGAQQIGRIHTGEDTLNVQYEAAYWTADPIDKVADYYGQHSIVYEQQSEERYHFIYLSDTTNSEPLGSTLPNEIRELKECRPVKSLQKLESCYSVLVFDLKNTALPFQGLPAWVTSSKLPNQYEGTLIYQQWWTAKSY